MIIDPYTWHRFAIETITHITPDTVAVGFTRPPAYVFRAGQYAVVRITKASGETYIRQYSFSSSPNDTTLELLIQREPEGEVSNWFYSEANFGDTVELSQPLGSFTLDKATKRPILLIAGRIGITPFISMLREDHRHDISVLYSVRTKDQICFPELLEQLDVHTITTDTSPRIDGVLLKPLLAKKPIVYICGSKQFVDAIAEYITSSGTPVSDVHRELFTLQ